jgi:molecular chaperone GrpE
MELTKSRGHTMEKKDKKKNSSSDRGSTGNDGDDIKRGPDGEIKGDEKEIETLKQKLEEKEKEAKDVYDRLLRTAADLENFKKRAAREKEDWLKYANEDVIKSILPFLDNLERAVAHAEKARDTGVLIEGIRLTIQQLLQGLTRFGVTPIQAVGNPFDPALHEAMLVVETDQHEPNRVVEEFQKGYLLNDRLLRPSTVSVSKPPGKEARTANS